MADVKISTDQLLPQAGSDSSGRKFAFIDSVAKATQNDTITLVSESTIEYAVISIDATGTSETHTISGNEITLTSATTGTVSGIIVYR